MFKKVAVTFGVFVCIFILCNLSSVSALDLKEGLWEITTKLDMPGMPFPMPPSTFTQCITKEYAVPKQVKEKVANCKTDQKVVGNTVEWTTTCQEQNGVTVMNGKVIYEGDRFKGEIKIKNPDGTVVTQHITGRRIGECK
jgi:hypothetical protein